MFTYLVVPVIAFITTLVMMPMVSAIASRLGAMDVPGELSLHTKSTPRTGGVAIFTGFLVATAHTWWNGALTTESSTLLPGILVSSALIAMAGILDDTRRISSFSKLLWQFLAASVAIGFAVQIRFLPMVGVGLALTLLYMVGSANAVNWLDGMDGLAGGISLIAAVSFCLIAIIQGNELVTILALALAGSVLGFLPFNFPRARVFMGDVGSLFLGFALASLGVLLADRPYDLPRFAIPLTVLSVPIINTTMALIRRFRRRNDLFTGDQDHIHNILARQWGNLGAVVATWAISAFIGGIAVAATWLKEWPGMMLAALAIGVVLWMMKRSGLLALLTTQEVEENRESDKLSATRVLAYLNRRYMHPVLLDLATVVASFYLALILRFSGVQPKDVASLSQYASQLTELIFFIAFVFAVSASLFGLYNRIWRYGSSQDTLAILGAGGGGTLAVLIADLGWGAEQRPIPISVVLMGGLLTTIGFVTLRHRQRFIDEVLHRKDETDSTSQRVLVVGAGEAGQHLARQMQNHNGRYRLVGFVDDDPEKMGLQIHGARVMGTITQIPDLVTQHQAGLVVIAMYQVSQERINEIFDVCQESSARIQILPDVIAQLDETNGHAVFRDLVIEDLLGRPPREIDEVACRSLITGKVVLVTGAAGSIGSELCRQVSRYEPKQILAVDQNETGLYDLSLTLEENCPLVLLVGDVSDVKRMEAIWRRHRPAVVFHCAAYKHVPILEECPSEAVKTNVLGTLVPATLSQRWGTERFIFISTDKAVCPVNVLGTSKRVGELLIMALQQEEDANRRTPETEIPSSTLFSVVRFGNVLGSRGSVVPTFARQIARGGPVKVTHPEMKRYFMSISEAVSLVIQAGACTTGGDLFVLDMGKEAHIDDLARKMIRLQGLRVGEDIPIEYTGVRPGEKLSEILLCPVREVSQATRHPSIMQVQNHFRLPEDLITRIYQMIELAKQSTDDAVELEAMLFDIARTLCPEQCACAIDALASSTKRRRDHDSEHGLRLWNTLFPFSSMRTMTNTKESIMLSGPDITEREIELVNQVLRTRYLSMGPMIERFEAAVADFVGARHAVAISSGTAGLHLAMVAAGLGPGDEVITTPFSFVASANCALYVGATPRFVDIDPMTLNLDPDQAEAAITPRTRALLPVHVFGQPCAMDRLMEIARKYNLVVIEDACEAIGAEFQGRQVGTFGACSVFAFYPNKQMTTGEGGMLITDKAEWVPLFRSLRNQGRDDSGTWLRHIRLGYNYRMPELSAALGVAQMERIQELLAKREQVANWYTERLNEMTGVQVPWVAPEVTRMSWFVYVVQVAPELDRDRIMMALTEHGVPTRPYFTPLHLQPLYQERFGFREGDFPITERVAQATLALPFSSRMCEGKVDRVCQALEGVIEREQYNRQAGQVLRDNSDYNSAFQRLDLAQPA